MYFKVSSSKNKQSAKEHKQILGTNLLPYINVKHHKKITRKKLSLRIKSNFDNDDS